MRVAGRIEDSNMVSYAHALFIHSNHIKKKREKKKKKGTER